MSSVRTVFRGDWANSTTHPNCYETAVHFGENGFEAVDQATVHTDIDENGESAIRANLAPVGFNKGRLRIAVENFQGDPAKVADMEVPAVVVVDPGHGGPSTPANVGGSSWNNATANPSGTLEKTMTLDFGLLLRDRLAALRNDQDLQLRVLMTREADDNFALATRAYVARDNGSDVLLSIHFNGFNNTVRGTETHIDHTDNLNRDEDFAFAGRVNDAVFGAIADHDTSAVDRGAKDERGLDVLSDPDLGNDANYQPVRASLVEVEFIDVPAVDDLLNTGANHQQVRQALVNAAADALIEEIKNVP
jgi:N-acetylmuramoyl-L-alanine amidase